MLKHMACNDLKITSVQAPASGGATLTKLPSTIELSPMRQAHEKLTETKTQEILWRVTNGLPAKPAAQVHSSQQFAARPAAFYSHDVIDQRNNDDYLPPPYGTGHLVSGSESRRIGFAVDTLCSPLSAVTEAMVDKLNLRTWEQHVTTTLATGDVATAVHTSRMAAVELVIHWNGKRRNFFLDCMVWKKLPSEQDLIIGMPDANDTGLIAFALPQLWRTSWLGTACFSGNFPLALRKDRQSVAAMHHEFIMKEEDEDLIDITMRPSLQNAHIITGGSSLQATQQYWLSQFPNLNSPIPKTAHPDLPQFDPPFDPAAMQTYQDKTASKVPRASPKLQDQINAALGNLADQSIVNMHANPVGVASYIVLVPKPDGTLRICINFSKINKVLLKAHHPLPCCADMLNKIARFSHYAKIDLKNGFYNFDVAESAKWLTSTIAPLHAFTWNKIPQGLAPVPQWFQWAMQLVLGDYIGTICLVYIDDLIILANNPDELNANIRSILERLDKYNFRIAIDKCDFEPNTTIDFLGHTISNGSISPGPKSSKILENIVNPNHETDVKAKLAKLGTFIGIVNWFGKYIKNCSQELLPLLNARENGWTWGEDQERAFIKMRAILADLQPLSLPSGGDNRLEVHTDASKDGWFAVLFEDTGIGTSARERLRVISYAGGVFRGPQIGWSILQKEMFAVFQAHIKFDTFIRLHEFRLVIDNRTMCFCETSSDMMVMRWWLRIQSYQSEIVHVPGVSNILPDAGSRLMHLLHPNVKSESFNALTSSIASNMCSALSAQTSDKHNMHIRQTRNSKLTSLLQARNINSLHASMCGCDGEVDPSEAVDDYSIRQLQTSSTTSSLTTDQLSAHGSASCSTVAPDSVHGSASCSTVTPASVHGSGSCSTVVNDDDASSNNNASTVAMAEAAFSVTSSACRRLAAEPSSARRALPITADHFHMIRQCHGGCAGHHGRDETIRKLQTAGLHWPSRFIDVARFIAACPICQRFRLKLKQPYTMYKTILTEAPLFGRWHCDWLTIGCPCSFTLATKIFIMEEERSRFVMLHACKDETAMEVVLAWLHTFSIFGIPESVYSDNAQNLIAASAKEFMELTGIRHDFSVPHQAHTNGLIESTCGDTGRLLRMLCDELHMYGKWSLILPLIQRQLNSLTRSTLGCSANQLVFGNRVNLDAYILPVAPSAASAEIRQAVASSNTVQAYLDGLALAQADLLHKSEEIRVKTLNDLTRQRPMKSNETLTVGTLVLVPWNDQNKRSEKLDPNFMGPYIVLESIAGLSTVSLIHSVSPAPRNQPATLRSSVADLRVYVADLRVYNDDLEQIEYDVPENRFRNLAYNERSIRPVNCILRHRPIAIAVAPTPSDVNNFEYEIRWADAPLDSTTWTPYSHISHTFAFEAYFQGASRTHTLTGHVGAALPADERVVHQSRAIAASRRSKAKSKANDLPIESFDMDSMSFMPPP